MGVEFCRKLSLHLLRWSYGFSPQFVNMVYHTDWFAYIEKSLHPWDKSHLIMVYYPFVLLDSVCLYFVEHFCIYVHQWYWPVIFFFFFGISVWFWYQGDGGLIEWVWKCSFLCIFWNTFRRTGVGFPLFLNHLKTSNVLLSLYH